MLTIMLVIGLLASSTGGALACSCDRPNARSFDETQTLMLQRAENVVVGRIVDIRGGERGGRHVLLAKMENVTAVKGSVSAGEITLVTDVQDSMCGAPRVILSGFDSSRDIAVEVSADATAANTYRVNYCGYSELNESRVKQLAR